ncbi:hypothetical protein OAV62_02345 [bacterium]|nr:hypothetical protein [bacterium]
MKNDKVTSFLNYLVKWLSPYFSICIAYEEDADEEIIVEDVVTEPSINWEILSSDNEYYDV